jgi:alpha-D-ribose 1-methylphosphonate 5-triphosphate synthase subunit PhnH
LLFIVNNNGVPSVGSFVQLAAAASTATLTSLSPSSAVVGGSAFTLTVNGTGFVNGATVRWNGQARTTTFVSSTQLRAAIPASDIAVAGTSQVTVVNPGAAASNALPFTITQAPAPPPSLSTLSPSSAVAGGAAFTLTVTGSNFVSGSVVQWNGAARTTAFVSATQLTAQIAASDIAAAGTASVTVLNQSVVSNALTFTITQTPPAPAPLTITTSSLPNARVGLAYSAPLAAAGGTGSYTWSLANGTLPKDLSLNPQTGVISGMPTSENSTTAPIRFTVQVSDAFTPPRTATKALSIKVQKPR